MPKFRRFIREVRPLALVPNEGVLLAPLAYRNVEESPHSTTSYASARCSLCAGSANDGGVGPFAGRGDQ
jgi:hypothetical protein